MSILVDTEIKKAIQSKEIVIVPFDEERIAPAAYYFSLGQFILLPKAGQTVNLKGGKDPEYEKVNISNDSYTLEPQQFILAQTKELITLNTNIAMFLDGRTAFARLGLQIHQTASFIHPGHTESIITLELFNAGNSSIILSEGVDIGKGIFFKLEKKSSEAYKEDGIYPSQKEVMGTDLPPYKNKSLL